MLSIRNIIIKRYWVYLFPGLMYFSLAAFLLFASVRAAQLGAGSLAIGMMGSTWGMTYALSSLALSRYASRSRAKLMMTASCLAFIIITVVFAFFNSLPVLFILMPACGMFTPAFFVGFQLFMGGSTGMSPAGSAAVYTIVGGVGYAFGALIVGSLIKEGIVASLLPMLCSSTVIIIGIRLLGYLDNRGSLPAVPVEESAPQDTTAGVSCGGATSTFVIVGWISMFTITLISSGLRFLLPKVAITFFNQPAAVAGGLVFVQLLTQGLIAIAYLKSSFGSYRLKSHVWAKLLAAAGCLCALFSSSILGLLALVLLVGVYGGHAYYKGVFYSLDDRERSGRNVAINEAVVGTAGVIGPTLSGAVLEVGLKPFFIFPIAIMAAALLLQATVVRRGKGASRQATPMLP